MWNPLELLADPGVEIPEAASKVHGITTEHAREHGQPHEKVLAETVERIRQGWADGLTLIVFNAPYDLTVLRQLTGDFTVTGAVYDPFVVDRAKDPYRKGPRTLSDLSQFMVCVWITPTRQRPTPWRPHASPGSS